VVPKSALTDLPLPSVIDFGSAKNAR